MGWRRRKSMPACPAFTPCGNDSCRSALPCRCSMPTAHGKAGQGRWRAPPALTDCHASVGPKSSQHPSAGPPLPAPFPPPPPHPPPPLPLPAQFVADCRSVGISVPILPGLMPIMTYGGFKRMTGFCKTKAGVPAPLGLRLGPHRIDMRAHRGEEGAGVAFSLLPPRPGKGEGLAGEAAAVHSNYRKRGEGERGWHMCDGGWGGWVGVGVGRCVRSRGPRSLLLPPLCPCLTSWPAAPAPHPPPPTHPRLA